MSHKQDYQEGLEGNGQAGLAELAQFFELSPDLLCIAGTDGYFKRLNPAFEKTLGWTPAELMARPFLEFVHVEDVPATLAEVEKLGQGVPTIHFENRYLCRDGSYKWLAWTSHPTPGGTLYAIARDMTERKRAEEALRQSEATYRAIATTIPGAIYQFTVRQGVWTVDYMSPRSLDIFGLRAEAFMEDLNNFIALIHPEDLESFVASVTEVVEQLTPWKYEGRVIKPTGEIVWWQGMSTPVANPKGEIVFNGVLLDITARKEAEEAIRQSEARLAEALKIARMGHWELDLASGMFTFNDQFYDLLHTTAEAEGGYQMAVAEYAERFVHPDDAYLAVVETQKALETTDPNYSSEITHRLICADGEERIISVSIRVVKDEQGRTIKTYGANQDITEQKRAEEALAESEATFRAIAATMPGAIFQFTARNGVWTVDYMSPGVLDVIGLRAEEAMEDLNKFIALIHPEDLEGYLASVTEAVEKLTPWKYEGRIIKPTGEIIWWQGMSTPAANSKGEIVFNGVLFDITARKEAEAALAKRATELETVAQVSIAASSVLETQELLQKVVDLTKQSFNLYHAHIYLLDETGERLDLTAGAGEVGRQMVAQRWHIPLEQEQSLVARVARSWHGVIVNDVQQRPDFLPNPLLPETRSEMAVPIMIGDEVLGVLDVQADKVDHFSEDDIQIQTTLAAQLAVAVQNSRLFEQSRAALVENQQQGRTLRAILETMPMGVFVADAKTGLPQLVNRAGVELLGRGVDPNRPADEYAEVYQAYLTGTDRLVPAESLPIVQVLAGAEVAQAEMDLKRPDQSRITIDVMSVPIRDEQGNMVSALALFQDITARKEAEEAVRQSEGLLRSVINNSTAVIYVKHVDGRYLLINSQYEKLFNLTLAETKGKTDHDIFPQEVADTLRANDLQVLAAGTVIQSEEYVPDPDGTLHSYVSVKFPLFDNAGIPYALAGISTDITERKRAEEALRQSEARLAEALTVARMGHWEFDVARGMFTFNDQLYDLLHTSAEAEGGYQMAPAEYAQRFIPPDEAQIVAVETQKALETTDPNYSKYLEHRLICADGEERIISVRFKIVKDEQGRTIKTYGANQDITEQKQVEAALRQSEARLAEVLTIARMGHWEFDVASGMFTFNDQFYDLLHTTAEAEGGYQMAPAEYAQRFIPPDEAQIVAVETQKALETTDPNYSKYLEHRLICADGEERIISARSRIVKDAQGRTIKIYGANQDITEQKRAEEALAESEATFRAIAATMPGAIFQFTARNGVWTVDYMSPGVLDVIGLRAEEAMEDLNKFIALIHPEDLEGYLASVTEAVEKLTPWKYEGRIIKPTGEVIWWQGMSTPVATPKGEIVFNGVLFDITARKQAEAAHAKRATELETVTQVGIAASTILDTQELLQQVVDLTKSSFNLYHAHIYLLNEAGNMLNLAAGAGAAGQQMVAQGWHIPLEREQSLVARAARTQQGVVVNDVQAEPGFLPNPLLPHTRAEMAVPMIVGEQVLGVLDVQAEAVNYFTDEDVRIQTILATQVGVALQNARFFERSERTLQELNALTRRLTHEGWQSYLESMVAAELDYVYDLRRVAPAGEHDPYQEVAAEPAFNRPLTIQGETIGHLALAEPQTLTEEVVEVLDAVAERLSAHLENLRLSEQTGQALAQTEALYTGIDRLIRTTTLDDIVQTLVESTQAQQFDRASLSFFDRPWAETRPEILTTAAVWTQSGKSADTVGTTYQLSQLPFILFLKRDEATLVPDVDADERIDDQTRMIMSRLGMHSLAVFPLLIGAEWIGIFVMLSQTPVDLSEEQLRRISSLVDQAAIVIQNQRLLEQMRAALQEANTFRQFIQTSEQGIGWTDLKGQVVYMNSAFRRLLDETDLETVIGKPIIEYYPEEVQPRLRNEILPTVMQTGQWVGELMLRSTTGRLTPTLETYVLIRDQNGQPLYIADLATDISERKAAEAERERLLAEIEAAYRQFVRREWEQFLGEEHQGEWRVEHQRPGLGGEPPAERLVKAQEEVIQTGKTKVISSAGDNGQQADSPAIVVPISLRGQAIGALSLQDIAPKRQWSSDEVALAEAVSEQLALTLENLRLFDETQKRATREQLTREITDKMRAASDVDTIIETGLAELAKVLGVPRVYVKLDAGLKEG